MSNFNSNTENKAFQVQKNARYALDSALDNLDVKQYSLYLNESVVILLNLYKKYENKTYSDSLNILLEENLNKLENMCLSGYSDWADTFNDYVHLTKFDKTVADFALKYLYIPKTKVKLEHKDVTAIIDKKLMDRLDSLKNTLFFEKASRDMLITYIISLHDFEDLDDDFRGSVIELFHAPRREIGRCFESISDVFVKVNIEIIRYVLRNGFLKSEATLLLRYMNESLKLYNMRIENDKLYIENKEFRENLKDIIELVNEEELNFKKNITSDKYLVLIKNNIKKLDDIIINYEKFSGKHL